MVLIYCVPFQCLWTEEKETEDLEVRSIFLCILYRIDYRLTATSAQTRKLKFVLLVQIVILIFLLSNNITVLIIRFEIWLSESSCHCHLLHLSNCKNKKGNFFLSYSVIFQQGKCLWIQLSTFYSSYNFQSLLQIKNKQNILWRQLWLIFLFFLFFLSDVIGLKGFTNCWHLISPLDFIRWPSQKCVSQKWWDLSLCCFICHKHLFLRIPLDNSNNTKLSSLFQWFSLFCSTQEEGRSLQTPSSVWLWPAGQHKVLHPRGGQGVREYGLHFPKGLQ